MHKMNRIIIPRHDLLVSKMLYWNVEQIVENFDVGLTGSFHPIEQEKS